MGVTSEMPEHRATIEQLCSKALEGTLRLDDFYRQWPCQPEKGSFLEAVYKDLEDGVQHTLGTWFAGKIDLPQWRESWEYSIICLDLQLLRSNKDSVQLLTLRQEVLAAKRMSLANMEMFVARRLDESA